MAENKASLLRAALTKKYSLDLVPHEEWSIGSYTVSSTEHGILSVDLSEGGWSRLSRMNRDIVCVACRKTINQKPRIMKLQITGEDPKFRNRARKLGFTSSTWRTGDSMEASFHKDCFNAAMLVWEVAFETRAVSPRRAA